MFLVSQHLDSSWVSRVWNENSQSSDWDWFWAHCGWFYLHVFLCWKWFSATYANTGNSWGLFLQIMLVLTHFFYYIYYSYFYEVETCQSSFRSSANFLSCWAFCSLVCIASWSMLFSFCAYNLKGAINLLLAVYKKEFSAMGGYLTDSWKVISTTVQELVVPSKSLGITCVNNWAWLLARQSL